MLVYIEGDGWVESRAVFIVISERSSIIIVVERKEGRILHCMALLHDE